MLLTTALRYSNQIWASALGVASLNGVYRSMAAKATREWFPPEGCPTVGDDGRSAPAGSAGLMLYNSLLDEKVPFVPADGPGSKQITWYTCGKHNGHPHESRASGP